MKLFKFPADISWIILLACFLIGVVVSSIFGNWIPIVITSLGSLSITTAWILIKLIPYIQYKNSIKFTFNGIVFCGYRNLSDTEQMWIQDITVHTIELLESLAANNCMKNTVNGIVVGMVRDIDENTFNTIWNTKYKYLSGYAKDKKIIIELKDDITTSSYVHELCHVIFDHCTVFKGKTGDQHRLMKEYVGV